MKTGYTRGAGHTLIGSATRNGRTMIAVVLNAVDPTGSTVQLLDKGFLMPIAFQGGRGYLPPRASVALPDEAGGLPRQQEVQVAAARELAAPPNQSSIGRDVLLITIGTLPALGIVLRRRRRDGKRPFFSWG
jgi:D-alanyl-D-alanine carboxypeptidase